MRTHTPSAIVAGVGLQLASGLSAEALLSASLGNDPRRDERPAAVGSRKVGIAPGASREAFDGVLLTVAAALGAHWSDGVQTGVLIAENLVSETAVGESGSYRRWFLPADIVYGGTSRVAASLSAHLGTRRFPYYATVSGELAGVKALMLAATTLQRSPATRLLLVAVDSSPASIGSAAATDASARRLSHTSSVALLLESPSLDTTHDEMVAIGGWAAGKSVRQATSILRTVPENIGMVFLPAGPETERAATREWLADRFPAARIVDPSAAFGAGPVGAGLVQAAIATTWLRQNPERECLVFAGSTAERQVIGFSLGIRESVR